MRAMREADVPTGELGRLVGQIGQDLFGQPAEVRLGGFCEQTRQTHASPAELRSFRTMAQVM
jgi:hypothetical protein